MTANAEIPSGKRRRDLLNAAITRAVRMLMLATDHTAAELAPALGVSPAHLSARLRGDLNWSALDLAKLRTHFGDVLDVNALLDGHNAEITYRRSPAVRAEADAAPAAEPATAAGPEPLESAR